MSSERPVDRISDSLLKSAAPKELKHLNASGLFLIGTVWGWMLTAAAFLFLAMVFVRAAIDGRTSGLVAMAPLVSVWFLPLTPYLLQRWLEQLSQVERRTRACLSPAHWLKIVTDSGRVHQFFAAPGFLPIVLVGFAYVQGDFFSEILQLGELPRPMAILGLLSFMVGGVHAGYAVWAGLQTIGLSYFIAVADDNWEPFVETASPSSEQLARFSLSTARLFSIGGGILVPGLIAVLANSDGSARAGPLAILAMILIVIALIVGVPAFYIAKGSRADKDAYMRTLSTRIEELADPLFQTIDPLFRSPGPNPDVHYADAYQRLELLLEIRAQVAAQRASPASVELLVRSPSTILGPALGVAGSLLYGFW